MPAGPSTSKCWPPEITPLEPAHYRNLSAYGMQASRELTTRQDGRARTIQIWLIGAPGPAPNRSLLRARIRSVRYLCDAWASRRLGMRRLAARPRTRRFCIRPVQRPYDQTGESAPSRIRTRAHGSGEDSPRTPGTCIDGTMLRMAGRPSGTYRLAGRLGHNGPTARKAVLGNEGAHYTGMRVPRDDSEDALAFAEALLDHIYVLRKRFEEFARRRANKRASTPPASRKP